MEADIDVNQGPDCSEYIVKLRILDFLSACLRASPNQPTIAHLLLGFKCGDHVVNVDAEGSFSRGISLFHTILDLVVNSPLMDDLGMASWLVSLNNKGLQVLKELWSSPITSTLVTTEMRSNDTFFRMFNQENVIQPEMLWNGIELSDPSFSASPALSCLSDFMPTNLTWFNGIDLHACLNDPDDPSYTSNLEKLEELLVLRRSELAHSNKLANPQDLTAVNNQAQELLEFYATDNQIKTLHIARLKILKSWVQLMLLMLQTMDFDQTSKTSIMLRTLQTIMPRLESDLDNTTEVMELAKLSRAVIFSLKFEPESFQQGDLGDLMSDRLFHLFQISLKAINSLGSKTPLKEIFYTISYRYLTGMSDVAGIHGIHRRHSTQTIKSAGERFIDVVCDDAYASEPTCRISALLILSALVAIGKHENSKYIIESLSRLNFITILVGSIQIIPNDLRETAVEHVDLQLSYINARLSLLLQISQSRFGATAVLNAGLFHAIKDSGLFAIDPELGVDIEGPNAVSKHYSLLAAIMRIICAVLLSRGAQNQQSLELGRRFLAENRLSILAVLKKSAGLVAGVQVSERIEELADSFMLLVTFTGFLEFEGEKVPKKPTFTAFT
ncbi:hypothetical protein G7Y89_g12787 [Cudoniella acicularis]|uniref:Uncharacterized protein n=1 Tax=Cudoniella acicularis TaxID=354080 RepID=A0A8H4VYU3_9HELO|nr:hypothetical protein G7Y89_g12787 [Cudoniella acicularis]